MPATSGQVIQAIADALGGDAAAATVLLHDRALSEAGERSKAGRGRGAARQTPHDITKVVTSFVTSPIAAGSVPGSVERVRLYSSLTCCEGTLRVRSGGLAEGSPTTVTRVEGRWHLPGFDLAALTSLPVGHSALDAIAGIIGSIADGTFHHAVGLPDEDNLFSCNVGVDILFHRPVPKIDIRIFVPGAAGVTTEEHSYHIGGSTDAATEEIFRRHEAGDTSWSGDLRETRQISFETLRRLGLLIGPKRHD